VKRFKSHHWFGYFFDNRRAILPHEILGTPVAKYSFTYGAMIRKGQLSEVNIPAYKQFMVLAG
jgi:hypothetical protein